MDLPMKSEAANETELGQNRESFPRRHILFAESAPGTTFGLVCDSEPSSLALLAAGVAGLAARNARRSERIKSLEAEKAETQAGS
jgi:hypothetical protein